MARSRSPNYPGIPLSDAVKRAATLRGKEKGKHFVPAETVLSHWGYSPKSSSGLVAMGALNKFGLLEFQGTGANRKARLTDRALQIILDGSPTRKEAIVEAALAPGIHRELWDEYNGILPSPDTLHYTLVQEKRFTDTGADDFIKQFRATIEYANLDASDAESESEADESSREFSIGDHVQWERNGVLQLPEARKITGFYDPAHAILEGSQTGVPVDELIAEEPPAGVQPMSLSPPSAAPPRSEVQMKQDTFSLDEGVAMLQWPTGMSAESAEEFDDWLTLIRKKVKRSVGQAAGTDNAQESDD